MCVKYTLNPSILGLLSMIDRREISKEGSNTLRQACMSAFLIIKCNVTKHTYTLSVTRLKTAHLKQQSLFAGPDPINAYSRC